MRLLYIIPGNIDNKEIRISTFIAAEVEAVKRKLEPVEVYYFTERSFISGFRSSLKSLNAKILEFKPDVIHVHYGSSTALLVALAKKSCPWLVTLGGSDILGHPNKGFYWRIREYFAVKLTKISIRYATAIICVSKNLSKAVPEKDRAKVEIIPRGIDTSFFRPKKKIDARKEIGWRENGIYVLFSIPRVNAEVKNLPLAREVIGELSRHGFKQVALEILQFKPREYIRQAMNAADVLLVTSLHEGSPNIVKESMACNLSIVSVNCGDVKERLEGVTDCYVSKKYDAKELAELVKKVLKKATRSNGNEMLNKQGITSDNISQRIIDLYNKVRE